MKEIQLLWVHDSQMTPGTVVKNHAHDYYHLIDVTAGQMRFFLGEEELQLSAGDMVLVRRGAVHRFSNEGTQPLRFHEIKFAIHGQMLPLFLQNIDNVVVKDPFARQLVDQLAAEFSQNRALKDAAAQATLSALVLYLTAETRSQDRHTPGVIDTAGYNKLSRRVVDYLTANYSCNLSLDDISEGVGVTKNYLCNAFKLNTGITIVDCLNMIRIRKAAEQIVFSDLPLAEVAQMCGYVSVSHFNRVFMRYVGMPPGQCRRAYAYDVAGNDARVPGGFISSVLAGKPITQDLIREFESRKGE